MNILYTINRNYIEKMLVSILSVLENSGFCKVSFHIISLDFELEDYKKIEEVLKNYVGVEIYFYSIKNATLERYHLPDWRGSQIANARLFFSSIIKDVETIGTMLYLDADTIVVGDLQDISLYSSNVCSAVLDEAGRKYLKTLCLEKYFNSGVLYFNVSKWLEEDCERVISDTIDKNKYFLSYPDQDILNFALQNKIGEMEYKYNMSPFALISSDFLKRVYYNRCIRDVIYQNVASSFQDKRILHNYGFHSIKAWSNNKSNLMSSYYIKYLSMFNESYTLEELEGIRKVLDSCPFLFYTLIAFNEYVPKDIKRLIKKIVR